MDIRRRARRPLPRVLCQGADAQQNDSNKAKSGGSSVWEDKYEIDKDMIPSIITQDFAQKVFLIGKSPKNFIRRQLR